MVHIKTEPLDINFEPSRMYHYVRSRQLEGSYPGSPTTGTWITTNMRVIKGWGSIEESLWPYDGDENHWPPKEPVGLDFQAKNHKILSYQRINTKDECRIALANKNFPIVGLMIDDSWNNPALGEIDEPRNQIITGSHAVCLTGYDDNKQKFSFVNSWGISWGDNGDGYLPYSYFPNRFLEGWISTAFDNIRPARLTTSGVHIYCWGCLGALGDIIHTVEFMDSTQEEMIAWGFAVENENYLDLQELFVRPAWRKQGYASKIATEYNQLSSRLGKKLRAWIPHSDFEPINYPALKATLSHMGLVLAPSPVNWASYIGLKQRQNSLFDACLKKYYEIFRRKASGKQIPSNIRPVRLDLSLMNRCAPDRKTRWSAQN